MTELIQIIMAFLGSLGFAVLYNIRGKKLIFSAIGGLLSWVVYVVASNYGFNEITKYFFAGLAVSIYSIICTRTLKAPLTVFLTPGIIPLVPGSGLYYTMSYGLNGQLDLFLQRGLLTVSVSVAIASGIMVASSLNRIFTTIIKYNKK